MNAFYVILKIIDRTISPVLAAIIIIFMLSGCAPQMQMGAPGGGMYMGGPAFMGGSVYGTAPLCKAPAGTLYEFDNDSEFFLEALPSDAAPLACNEYRTHVSDCASPMRRLVPPHTPNVKYKMTNMDNLTVTFVAYSGHYMQPNGCVVVEPAHRYTQHPYSPADWPTGIHQNIVTSEFIRAM